MPRDHAIMRPSLRGSSVAPRPSVRQSVTRLRFFRNRKTVETFNLLET